MTVSRSRKLYRFHIQKRNPIKVLLLQRKLIQIPKHTNFLKNTLKWDNEDLYTYKNSAEKEIRP